MNSLVGLFTDVLPPGGVQRAGRHVAAVAAKFAGDRGLDCSFLSLNDPHGAQTVLVDGLKFHLAGHGGSKIRFLKAALRAAKTGPVLVIAMHPHLAPVVSLMRARSRALRSIVFTHGVEVWQPMSWTRRSALQRADLVCAPSADTVRQLMSLQGISPGRVQKLPWALDPEFEARVAMGSPPAPPEEFPRGARTILAVGRWDSSEKYKGADTLIAAFPRVLDSSPDTHLVLVGDGSDRPRLEQLARELGVDGHTHFLRGLTLEQLSACYAACDLFALPSRGEGFGMVFLEAMAYSKPAIGGNHGGILDIVENGKTGLLVPHSDLDRLVEAVQFILSDPVRAREMGARGQERVATGFTFAQFQSRLTAILSEVLARAQRSGSGRAREQGAGV